MLDLNNEPFENNEQESETAAENNMLEVIRDAENDEKNELLSSLNQLVTTQASGECVVPVATLRQLLDVARNTEVEFKNLETITADKDRRITAMDRQISEALLEINKFRVNAKIQDQKDLAHKTLLKNVEENNAKIDSYKKQVRAWAIVLTVVVIVSCGLAGVFAGKYFEREKAGGSVMGADSPAVAKMAENYVTKAEFAELSKLIQNNAASNATGAQIESLLKRVDTLLVTSKTQPRISKEASISNITAFAPGKVVSPKNVTVEKTNPVTARKAAPVIPVAPENPDKKIIDAANSYTKLSSLQRGLIYVFDNEIVLNSHQGLKNLINQGLPVQSKVVLASHREIIGRLTRDNISSTAVSIPLGGVRESVKSVCLQLTSEDATKVYTLECVTDASDFIHLNQPGNVDEDGMNQLVDLIKYRYNSKEAGELGKVAFREANGNAVVTVRLNSSIREAISDGFLIELVVGYKNAGGKKITYAQAPLNSHHADSGMVEITLGNVTLPSEIQSISLKANDTSSNFGALNSGLNLPALQSIVHEEGSSLQSKISSGRS